MSTLQISSRTDDAGNIQLNLGVPNSEVTITVELPDLPCGDPKKRKQDWEDFVKRTQGSIKDPSFRRHPQGEYPKRESLA
jgi:hypothetical protein